jgi:hypothetical protein
MAAGVTGHQVARFRRKGTELTDDLEANDERPCLHCLIADLIDEFYEQNGSLTGEPETADVSEIITAFAKIVAEMTVSSDAALRKRILKEFAGEVSKFEVEFREGDTTGAPPSGARH